MRCKLPLTGIWVLIVAVVTFPPPSLASGISFGGFGFGSDDESGVGLDVVVDVYQKSKQAMSNVDLEEERKIGEDAAAIILGATPVLGNDALNAYVNKVGSWVAQQSERPDLAWRFAVLDTVAVNAYATPGGYIFITAGLLLRLNSEAELATVLAHEIVHVVQRHHIRALKKTAALGLVGSVAGAATGNQAVAAITLDGIEELYERGLGREDELESDHMGAVLATRAGYDPYAFMSVLLLLDSMNPEDPGMKRFLATHPAPIKRLQSLDDLMKGRMEKYSDLLKGEQRFVNSITASFEAADGKKE